jgi:hypothetical protein
MASTAIDSLVKPQAVRLFDVFFLGPLMWYAGSRLRRDGHQGLGASLQFFGITTALYNGANYLELRQ